MTEPILIITNNNMAFSNFNNIYRLDFVKGSAMDVLIKARDYIHKGHRLLTHPLISSIKPNEIPYRTIVITQKAYEVLDYDSLKIIEDSIHTTEKFIKAYGYPEWNKSLSDDFALIDYDLIKGALN